MSSSPGNSKLLPRGRSPFGPTKTAWTTRCDHLLPRGEFTWRTRSRRQKARYKTRATSAPGDIGNVPEARSCKCVTGSFMWEDLSVWDLQDLQADRTPQPSSESDDDDVTTDPTPPWDFSDDRCVAVEEKEEEFHYEETEHNTSVESNVQKIPLKRQPSCDSLFTGKHIKPDAVWTPYGPPLYGYGSSLNPPRRKGPDTLVILAAIFYCLAALTAVVFAVLFETNVLSVYMPPEPVPAWVQQFSPEMQRWYRLALAGGRDASAIQPPGTVQQPTLPPSIEEFCGKTSLPESLPALRHGHFSCTSIAYYNIHVRMCSTRCHVGYRTDDAGLLFCNRGRWAPIRPEVVSTLVGVGRAADTMPNTDPRVFEHLGITDEVYADVAFNILVKLDQVPNLSIVKTYLDMISENNVIDFDMMRQLLIWVGPNIEDVVANLDFLEVLSRLETFGATRHPVCRIVDCGAENLAHGRINSSRTTYNSSARVVCDRGYLPRHPVLTCEATGQWDKPALCDPATCSPPDDPSHGSYLCQRHVFSDLCDVICDVGYVPETDDTLGCSWTGNWTAFPRGNTTEMENALSADAVIPQALACVIADCGNISITAHGDVTCTGTTYGETCHLTCQDGYERLNQDNFTCQVHGDTAQATWSGEPKCIPVSCGAPPEFPHTAIQCASGHTYGNTCGVTCADGYEGTNHQNVICHSTGNWSLQTEALQQVLGEPDLFCRKKDCDNLQNPSKDNLTCSGTRYQDTCRLACEPGYKVADESGHLLHSLFNFQCNASGQWNDKPRCIPSNYCRLGLHDCHPEHGICILTGHQAFSCRCRVGTVGDGRRCERTACPPFPIAEPENGFFSCSIPTSSAINACQSASSVAAEYEVVCGLHCNHGYDRLIYAEYSCGQDGNWTIPVDINSAGITPCLAVKCPDLSSPLHGGMTCDSGSSFRYPEACSFSCDRGYEFTPTSSHERRCQDNATWSGNDAECNLRWLQVFATVKGTGQTAVDAWSAGVNVLHDKSPLVEQWGSLGIKRVKIVLEASTRAVELVFNGENTDKFSWFSEDRLISSPWNDITTEPNNFFSIVGAAYFQRTFFINRSYATCPRDYGWLVLAEGNHCAWERAPVDQRPFILFSRTATYVNWNDGTNVGRADRMVIYIQKGCPDGYSYHQHSRLCYKAFNQQCNYTAAVATCSSDGGTLAIPRDRTTNAFLINLKNAVDNNAYFRFGLTDVQQEGRWVWADGAALGSFTSWHPAMPDNSGGNEDCAEYWTPHDTWNDFPCSDTSRKFICQVTPN